MTTQIWHLLTLLGVQVWLKDWCSLCNSLIGLEKQNLDVQVPVLMVPCAVHHYMGSMKAASDLLGYCVLIIALFIPA